MDYVDKDLWRVLAAGSSFLIIALLGFLVCLFIFFEILPRVAGAIF